LFELGEQWIANEPPSRMLFRFWHDAGTGRTRRQSLRTEDIEEAKLRLAELILKGGKQTADALLSVVLDKYVSEVVEGTPSEGVTNSADAKILTFWERISASLPWSRTSRRNSPNALWAAAIRSLTPPEF
jgi:hypothetical protein